jgi:hypothetical protein
VAGTEGSYDEAEVRKDQRKENVHSGGNCLQGKILLFICTQELTTFEEDFKL